MYQKGDLLLVKSVSKIINAGSTTGELIDEFKLIGQVVEVLGSCSFVDHHPINVRLIEPQEYLLNGAVHKAIWWHFSPDQVELVFTT